MILYFLDFKGILFHLGNVLGNTLQVTPSETYIFITHTYIMPTFIAYQYSFHQLPPSEVADNIHFPDFANECDSNVLSNQSLNMSFYKGFEVAWHTPEKKLNLYSVKKNKDQTEEPELYENNIEAIQDGVVLMVIRNHKMLKFTPKDDTEKSKIDDYPWCYAIIDTRPQSQHILIEKKKEAFNSPEMVGDIISKYCTTSLQLPQIGWEYQYSRRVIEGYIWDIVDSRLKYKKDRVKSLGFHFFKREDDDNDQVDVALQTLLSAFATAEGDISVYNEDSSGKSFDHKNETMRRTIEMMIRNEYTIKVGFDKTGTIEYTKKKVACPEYVIEPKVLAEFKNEPNLAPEGESAYDLTQFLDDILGESTTISYQPIKKIKKNGRKKRNSKSKQSA